KPQLVEFVVDGRFFLNVKIRRRNVSLGLVVVVIRNKILDRIVRKEILELVIKLRRQGLVVRHHERRPIGRLNHLRHGESLARPGNSQQYLMLLAIKHTASERLNRRSLIALRLVTGYKFEVHKEASSC